ncbi:hypothetical protein J6590_000525 [Homalodisca vitripennis]|nr:hypothetical protein J6590_000525 [Homalodisca vitripennis]
MPTLSCLFVSRSGHASSCPWTWGGPVRTDNRVACVFSGLDTLLHAPGHRAVR